MAPRSIVGYSTRKRRDNNNNNNNGGGNKSGDNSNNGGSSDKESSVKVITQQVTVTATTVQTSVLVSVEDTSSILFTPTSSIASSPIASSPIASSPIASSPIAPIASSPIASSPIASSPSITKVALPLNTSYASYNTPSMKMSLPVASIISIILSSLFFITLCLVIYVRYPTLPGRILKTFRENYRRPPPTIGSFEPKEYTDYAPTSHLRRSFISYLPLTHHRSAASRISQATSSVSRQSVLLPSNPSYEHSPKTANTRFHDRASMASVNSTAKDQRADEERAARRISEFGEYAFEEDSNASRDSVKPADWRNTTHTTRSFPQSVDRMTME